MAATEITVLVADDHALVRKGFRRMLEDDPAIRVVGEACDGAEAVDLAVELRPKVAVMDLSMPGLNGIQATMELARRAPDVAVLMVSMYSEEANVKNALAAGARGYILKNAIDIDLATAVKRVAAGQKVIGPGLLVTPGTSEPEDKLTQRERQILQLIAEGKSNKEIAALLRLSVNTVSVHRANLMQALGIHRTAELVLYAVRKGLVHLP